MFVSKWIIFYREENPPKQHESTDEIVIHNSQEEFEMSESQTEEPITQTIIKDYSTQKSNGSTAKKSFSSEFVDFIHRAECFDISKTVWESA